MKRFGFSPSSPSLKLALVCFCLVFSALMVGSAVAGPAGGQSQASRDPLVLPTRATRASTTNNLYANATRLAATTAALGAKAGQTATALSGKISATTTALASRFAPTLTALAFTAHVTGTIPADQAATALASYASQVLGTSISVVKAGGVTAEVTMKLNQIDVGAQAQSAAVDLATTSYGGVLSNGAATLSYGTGTVSGNVDLDVQGASLGVYSLVTATTEKLTPDTALALARATFPALAGFDYAAYPVKSGYAWLAAGYTSSIDGQSHQVVTIPQAILLYVLPGSGAKTASLTATVGRGDFARTITLP